METVRRFFSQAWLYRKAYTAAFRPLEFATFDIMTTFFTMFFYIIVAAFSFNTTDLTRWVIGNAFLICVAQCIHNTCMTFTGERVYGRLRSIVVSPTSALTVVFQRAFYAIISGFVSVIIGFVVGALVFGVSFAALDIPKFILTVFVSAFAATGFGLFISVFGLLSDSMQLIHNTASYALMLLSGANFSVEQFPIPIQWLANIFPLNHGISAANLCFKSEVGSGFGMTVMIELLVGLAYYVAAFLLVNMVTRAAVRRGTLETF